jgi:hypothetical protein
MGHLHPFKGIIAIMDRKTSFGIAMANEKVLRIHEEPVALEQSK